MLILLLTSTVLTSTAFAQNAPALPPLNAQNHRPPVDSELLLWTDDASLKPDGWFSARLWGSYARNPLIYEFADGTTDDEVLLGDLLQLDLIPAISYKHLRLGVDLPIYLLATGTQVNTGTGLGDIAFDLKGTLLDTDDAPLGLAAAGRLTLPTASVDAPLGSAGLQGELSIIADKRLGDLLLAANIGTRFGPEVVLDNVTINDQFVWRLGGGYAITDDTGLSLDFAGSSTYASPLSNPAASPIEGMVGGWQRFDAFVLRAGVGSGLTTGVGSPDFRAVLAFAYEPAPDRDTDLDGVVDRQDDCREDPEDLDGWQDDDGCPDPSTKVMFRFVDDDGYAVEGVGAELTGESIDRVNRDGAFEIELHPGEYEVHAGAAGYEDVSLTTMVPTAAHHEVIVQMHAIPGVLALTVEDPEGRPAPFRWAIDSEFTDDDDGQVEQQIKPGRYILRVQADGYMSIRKPIDVGPGARVEEHFTLQPSKIVVTKERIELSEEVYFDTGKATIKPESFSMLTEVANVLKDNPDITKVRIEGHTDSRGSAAMNQRLSEARAKAVLDFLVEQGVEPERLSSQGFGETRPLVRGNNEAAWAKNRRVDIFIEERADD